MKKKIFSLFLLMCIFSLLCCNKVYAEEDETACTYEVKARLNKIAQDVNYSYSFVYDETDTNKVVGFDISIFNITEDIYITYKVVEQNSGLNENKEKKVLVTYPKTNNGTYTFRTNDIENVVTYQVSIFTNKYRCADYIRRFQIVKPKRNEYHDKDFCQDEELNDYFYCKEWINQNIALTEDQVKKSVQSHLDKVIVSTTTKCLECEIQAENVKNSTKFSRNKVIVIAVITLAMILDIILMIVKFINIRKARI